jgi:DNA-binding Xre family transcriptional regulator
LASVRIPLLRSSSGSFKRQLTALVLAVLVQRAEYAPGVSSPVKAFGERVRLARQARGWTQEDLAAKSGLAVVQVSRIERGVREVRLTTILRLVAALGTTPNDLLNGL